MFNQKGLTLFEVLTSLAIVSTLSTIGYPSLQSWYQRACFRAEVSHLVSCLHLAKMEAVKSNSHVVIDAKPDGYSVFVDASKDWVRQDGERELINYRLKNGITLATNYHLPEDKTRFNSRPGVRAGRFILTGRNGKRTDIIVDTIGRIRVE